MKVTNKKYTFRDISSFAFVAMATLLTACQSPAEREAQQYCNCLDHSLNSDNVVEGGLIYAGCKQMYQGSLQRLSPADTTEFKDKADSYETLFWLQAAAKGIKSLTDPQTSTTDNQ